MENKKKKRLNKEKAVRKSRKEVGEEAEEDHEIHKLSIQRKK